MYRILLIEDDPALRREAEIVLGSLGHRVLAVDAAEAMSRLGDDAFDLVLAAAPPASPAPRPVAPRVPPAVVYLPPAFSTQALIAAVDRVAERDSIQRELRTAQAALEERRDGSRPVGRSPAMRHVLERVDAVADSAAPVLLTGESGTGKDLLARAIFRASSRRDAPFVAVNCAAFPETLLEAELFGHERGAFTGALRRREGRFKAADGGTLFLDEINGLSLPSQAKLLRVLQDGSFQPIGTNATISVDTRLISATNRDLKVLVAEGKFREDLYYRIKVLELAVPPLRERAADIPLLVQFFLAKFARPGREPPGVSPSAWAALTHHAYPGNVRELEHAIQHALVFSHGREIELGHLPQEFAPTAPAATEPAAGHVRPLSVAMREFEHAYLLRALDAAGGSKTDAARMLGVSRKTLWHKLTKRVEEGVAEPTDVDGYDR